MNEETLRAHVLGMCEEQDWKAMLDVDEYEQSFPAFEDEPTFEFSDAERERIYELTADMVVLPRWEYERKLAIERESMAAEWEVSLNELSGRALKLLGLMRHEKEDSRQRRWLYK